MKAKKIMAIALSLGLIAGMSQVSFGARIFKISRNEVYSY